MEENQKQKTIRQTYTLPVVWGLCVSFGLVLALKFLPSQSYNQTRQNSFGQPQVLGAATGPLRGPKMALTKQKFIKINEPWLKEVMAKSFLVYDGETGQNLLVKNSETQLGIASLTKLLTAYTAYQYLDMAGEVLVPSSTDINIRPSLGLKPNDSVKTLDLFNSMLIGSENDAAEVLAKALEKQTGQDPVGLMNQQAKTLGMNSSHFSNPYGFDYGNNYSTAEDLKKLIQTTQQLIAFTLLENKTGYEFKTSTGMRYFAKATNKLIGRQANIYAIKTGFTESSLGSIALKTYFEGRPIVVIVIGSQNREKDALLLIDQVTRCFKLES